MSIYFRICCTIIWLSCCLFSCSESILTHRNFVGFQITSSSISHKFLTFPYLFFDFSSPYPFANSFCLPTKKYDPKKELVFKSGVKSEHSFECSINDPKAVQDMFNEDILIQVGLNPESAVACIMHSKLKNDTVNGQQHVIGFKLIVTASALGFSQTYYSVDICQVDVITVNRELEKNDIFQQIIVLDGGPVFISGSIFIGMGGFILIFSCLILFILSKKWGVDPYSELEDDEEQIGHCESNHFDISYMTEEERKLFYMKKVNDQLMG
ncbi:hypothetical protein CYY_001734 [Polysphondylium violaceum]|uniref:Transmembrane protein n=1 Tax=Polysphondylium violaceum TaxID=133409 RepID=A0A8J4PZB5_9MYCE|nr:hypothetical protein CYY_001734 [Polysphondylium violaceum]